MDDSKSLPTLTSYEEMITFWDTHSLADYWDQTEPATLAQGACRRPRQRDVHGPARGRSVRHGLCCLSSRAAGGGRP